MEKNHIRWQLHTCPRHRSLLHQNTIEFWRFGGLLSWYTRRPTCKRRPRNSKMAITKTMSRARDLLLWYLLSFIATVESWVYHDSSPNHDHSLARRLGFCLNEEYYCFLVAAGLAGYFVNPKTGDKGIVWGRQGPFWFRCGSTEQGSERKPQSLPLCYSYRDAEWREPQQCSGSNEGKGCPS